MSFATEGLTHRFGEREVLRGVSLHAGQGELFGLLGPNGSGKSTFLRILATLEKGWSGHAEVAGYDVAAEAAAVRRSSALVLQDGGLDPRLTALENLLFFGKLFGLSGARLREAADRGLQEAALADRSDAPVRQLSGGQRRRVEIARAMLGSPKVLFLDEACSGLDVAARQTVWNQIRGLRRERGVSIVFTTHMLDEAEEADRLTMLFEGRVAAEGTPQQLKREFDGDLVELRTGNTVEISTWLADELRIQTREAGGMLILESADGAGLIAELYRRYGGQIESASVRKPGLEDSYLRHTGHRLREQNPE